MSRALWFALKFVALTAPLTWLWVTGGRELYASCFTPLADAVYELFGVEGVKAVWRERYINQVPFVALMLLTPSLGLRQRLVRLALGVVVILLAQIALNGIVQYGRATVESLPIGLAILSDALPFVLWALLAREFLATFVPADPPCDYST